MKEYKRSIIAIIYNFILTTIGFIIVTIITWYIFKWIFVFPLWILIYLLYMYFFFTNKIHVVIKEDDLSIKIGKKEKNFKISCCTFSYKIVKNNDLYLYVNENGNLHFFDLSLIGITNFYKLINDLNTD